MMELLKHFEEDSMDDSVLEALQGEEDEESGADLVERIGGLDLGRYTYSPWTLLTNTSQTRHHMMNCGLHSPLRNARSSQRPSMTRIVNLPSNY